MNHDIEDAVLLILTHAKLVELSWAPGFNGTKPLGVTGRIPSAPINVWGIQCYHTEPVSSPHDRNNTGYTARVQVRVRAETDQQVKDAHKALTATLTVEHTPMNGLRLTGQEASFSDIVLDSDGKPEQTINYTFIIA